MVEAIEKYLDNGRGTLLRLCMESAGLISDMDTDEFASTVGRELYWNWDKRPDLTPKL